MRISKILEKLSGSQLGAVVVDGYPKEVILWTLSSSFREERDLRELRRYFPSSEKQSLLLKLGKYPSLVTANSILAQAREISSFLVIP